MTDTLSKDRLIELTLASFYAEKTHDVQGNRKILHDEFAVTDMVVGYDGTIFPRLQGEKLDELINEAFAIKGREYIFQTVMANEETQTVIVEFIESYPDPHTDKVYRTPQVSICMFKAGKLYRTRHYMDPRLSYEYLSEDVLSDAMA